jgi:hypothetical protein
MKAPIQFVDSRERKRRAILPVLGLWSLMILAAVAMIALEYPQLLAAAINLFN